MIHRTAPLLWAYIVEKLEFVLVSYYLKLIMANHKTEVIKPGTFEPQNHWYSKALNAQIHPLVSFFMNLGKEKIINHSCHLNPLVDKEKLHELLSYQPMHSFHAGT